MTAHGLIFGASDRVGPDIWSAGPDLDAVRFCDFYRMDSCSRFDEQVQIIAV
jgi:hypothetical protein